MFLPTLGENFGHVVPEALAAGCPVLLSDRTPWHDLEQHGAGWTLPLQSPEAFRRVVQQCTDMPAPEFDRLRTAAIRYAQQYSARTDAREKTKQLFETAIAAGRKSCPPRRGSPPEQGENEIHPQLSQIFSGSEMKPPMNADISIRRPGNQDFFRRIFLASWSPHRIFLIGVHPRSSAVPVFLLKNLRHLRNLWMYFSALLL